MFKAKGTTFLGALAGAGVPVEVMAGTVESLGLGIALRAEAVERVANQARNRGRRRPARGGGGVSRISTPEFAERPGETFPNRPASDRPRERPTGNAGSAAQLSRTFFRALRERGIGTGGGGGPFGGGGAIVDPGTYTVVLRLGDRTWETQLDVVRAEGYEPEP